eukprot:TRINITY_DN63620_c0_g1_i1.p1 TRINITY_DN63620_c0_g1~~TRINITY_DN63620_c0_g1_i1.p1  ORF type:complete len:223 (+),score=40.95 TRINITY_DN63620_c0_g1_i1:66-734(+)
MVFRRSAPIKTDQAMETAPCWDGVCVAMMQNLPCRCTSEEILEAVEDVGFRADVNFLHIPRKMSGRGRNNGYGFIGFLTTEITQKFRDAFDGYILKTRSSHKQIKLMPAHEQPSKGQAQFSCEDLDMGKARLTPTCTGQARFSCEDFDLAKACQTTSLVWPQAVPGHEQGLVSWVDLHAAASLFKQQQLIRPPPGLEQGQGDPLWVGAIEALNIQVLGRLNL